MVAECAGQNFFDVKEQQKDASGNIKKQDIGVFLRDKIIEEFTAKKFPYALRYIDPSYIIRSAPANANDSKFCNILVERS